MRSLLAPRVLGLTVLLWSAPSFSQCLLEGVYTSTPSVVYDCAFGLVDLNIQEWDIAITGNQITVTPVSGTFGTLEGTINCQTGVFSAVRTIFSGPGGCTESYTLSGQIQSIAGWTGTFQAAYTGGGCSFAGCGTQQWSVSGALPPTGVRPGGTPPSLAWMEVGPNPFGATTTMRVHFDLRQHARLVIRDVKGRQVATIIAGTTFEAGDHEFSWDGRTQEGLRAPAGVYFVHLRTDAAERVAKLVILD